MWVSLNEVTFDLVCKSKFRFSRKSNSGPGWPFQSDDHMWMQIKDSAFLKYYLPKKSRQSDFFICVCDFLSNVIITCLFKNSM